MKHKILKLSTIILLFAFIGVGCQKDEIEYVDGYIVGSFQFNVVDEDGHTTDYLTPRGYCILLKENENIKHKLPMDLYSFNLPDSICEFSEDILQMINEHGCGLDCNYEALGATRICGPCFFPDSLRTKYKIRFKYRNATKKEKIDFTCPCSYIAIYLPFPWEEFNQVILKDVKVINL